MATRSMVAAALRRRGGRGALLGLLLSLPIAASAAESRPDARFGAWGVTCAVPLIDSGLGAERCIAAQVVTAGPNRRGVLLGVALDYFDSAGTPTIHFRFAPGAIRNAGIGVKVDDLPSLRLAISDCDARRCEAAGRLTGDIEATLRAGRLAQVAFLGPDRRQIVVPVALNGIGAALDALRNDRR